MWDQDAQVKLYAVVSGYESFRSALLSVGTGRCQQAAIGTILAPSQLFVYKYAQNSHSQESELLAPLKTCNSSP
jgi:hypothetical protein